MTLSNGQEFSAAHAAVWSNPNFEIQNGARAQDGRPFDLRPLFLPAAMITEQLMDHIERTVTAVRATDGAAGHPRLPKVIFSSNPAPNATATVSGQREIRLNLGLVIALCSLPITSALLADSMKDPNATLSGISGIAKSQDAITEIARLMESWRVSSVSDWRIIPLHDTELTHWWLFQEMLRFVIAHETAHWLHSLYKDEFRRKLLENAEQDIRGWIGADRVTNPQVLRNIQQLLQRATVLERWKAETAADATGFQLCLQAFGGATYPRLRMTAYAGAALVFALNGMLEMFFDSIGAPISGETHPSSYARLQIFTHILARQFSLPHSEFLKKEFGAGVAVGMSFGALLSNYQSRRIRPA